MRNNEKLKNQESISLNTTKETSPSGVSRLILNNFRSYEFLDLKIKPDLPVVLFGKNGSGKTNILEAISLFAPGRGLRGAKLSLIERLNNDKNNNPKTANTHQERWATTIELEDDIGKLKLSTAYVKNPQSNQEAALDKRICKVNQEPIKNQSDLTEYLSILWVTPQMDRLFIDASSSRRKFLDRLVFTLYTDHARLVTKLDNLNRERLKVLKMGAMDDMWLSAIEDQIASIGVAVAASRNDLVEKLSRSQNWALGLFPKGELSINCPISQKLQNGESALSVEEFYKLTLKENRSTDQQSGSTTFGCHKADLDVIYKDKGNNLNMPAQICSTGEQKALLLSIVMAAIRMLSSIKKSIPILLLDEVVAHLDQNRRDDLFEEIKNLCIQCWMTGTDCSMFNTLGSYGQFIEVSNSSLKLKE